MNGKDYLLLVNYHTSYPEVSLVPEATSAAVIKRTKSIFARNGIPETVITENGPQFSSKEFREFRHTTCSPRHPRSNGKVEHTVQTVKALVRKAKKSGGDPYLALLSFRACPNPNGNPAPAVVLMKRNLRTCLPSRGISRDRRSQ